MTSPKIKQEKSTLQIFKEYAIILLSTSIFLSILITIALFFVRQEITMITFNYFCQQPMKNDFSEEMIFNAINLNHSIKENENNEDKLVNLFSDVVTWFGRKRAKDNFHFRSEYDCFCFTNLPKHDLRDPANGNHELVINGFHRYRKPEENFIKLESLYAKIERGKIKTLKTIYLDQHNGTRPDWINSIYKHFVFYSFSFLTISIFLILLILAILDKLTWLRKIPIFKGFIH